MIDRAHDLPIGILDTLVAEADRLGFGFPRRLVEAWSSGANRFDQPGEAFFAARSWQRLSPQRTARSTVYVCGRIMQPPRAFMKPSGSSDTKGRLTVRMPSTWDDYYKKASARPPWPLLLDALARFDGPGLAVDLGSGAGVETLEMLDRGWRVLAVDSEPAAFAHMLPLVPEAYRDRLETRVAPFEGVSLPTADLVWSSLSLSFCQPDLFNNVWAEIIRALRPGGRIACDLFGDRHAWSENTDQTFFSADRIHELLKPLAVESLVEEERERMTAFKGEQHWHGFQIIARKLL